MRRYTELQPSAGTTWPPAVRRAIRARDQGCAGPAAGMPGDCHFALEIDHVRASGGLGMKSPSTVENGVLLCGAHHMMKTREGRKYRPLLIAYIEAHPVWPVYIPDAGPSDLANPDPAEPAPVITTEHAHVEPVHGCLTCYELEA